MLNSEIPSILEDQGLVDRLAAVEHERWAHWQEHLHAQCTTMDDGSLLIPAELVARWSTQIATSYDDLSDAEQESDRQQVRRYLPLIIAAIAQRGGAD